ncbi:MAG: phytanoyl-CoA dioxygenase family protein [Synoicihabitans sp.]
MNNPPVPDYARPATKTATHQLTEQQVAFFHRHGYLALDAIMPPEEVPAIREIYDRLFDPTRTNASAGMQDLAGTGGETGTPALPQILQPAKFAPELLETQLVANIKAIMRQLLGEETVMVGDHAINKPPRSEAVTPWHQDEAYWDPAKAYSSLSIWVPLQPATIANGCMHFVPGSHQLEVVPHRPIDDDPRKPGLEIEPGSVDLSSAVACELPPGGATLHTGRTLHYAPANGSDDYRRAYIAMGSARETSLATPRHFPWQERQAAARA